MQQLNAPGRLTPGCESVLPLLMNYWGSSLMRGGCIVTSRRDIRRFVP